MLPKKLRIKENTIVTVLNAPSGYKKTLGVLPKGVGIQTQSKEKSDFIHLFVKNKAELEKEFLKTAAALNPGGLLWISYPKTNSGMKSDLTRDKGWESLYKIKMQWLSLISFDENWSAFLMKNEAPKDQSKASKDYQENVASYIDSNNKTVKVPKEMNAIFQKNKKAVDFFQSLSFTNKKEYVIWIVSAKQESTRNERLKKMIDKLKSGKKNPTEK